MYCIKLLFNIKLKRTSVCVCVCALSHITHTLSQHGEDEVTVHSCVSSQALKRGCTAASVATFPMKTLPNTLGSCDDTAAPETHSQPINTLAALTSYVKKKKESVKQHKPKADILFFKMYKNPMKICKHKN